MNIRFGRWRIEPYATSGMRCWQVYHDGGDGKKAHSAWRYYDNMGDALRFCAEWDTRNDVQGDYDLPCAIAQYQEVAGAIIAAAEAVS